MRVFKKGISLFRILCIIIYHLKSSLFLENASEHCSRLCSSSICVTFSDHEHFFFILIRLAPLIFQRTMLQHRNTFPYVHPSEAGFDFHIGSQGCLQLFKITIAVRCSYTTPFLPRSFVRVFRLNYIEISILNLFKKLALISKVRCPATSTRCQITAGVPSIITVILSKSYIVWFGIIRHERPRRESNTE